MSQTTNILKHLKQGNTITPLEALNKFGCMRLGARIYDLKKKGYNIEPKIVEQDGKHYAEYKLT